MGRKQVQLQFIVLMDPLNEIETETQLVYTDCTYSRAEKIKYWGE